MWAGTIFFHFKPLFMDITWITSMLIYRSQYGIWNFETSFQKDWNERVIFSHVDPIYSLCSQIITFNALYLTLFMKILNELPNRLNFGQLMSFKIWISKIREKITRDLSKDCMLKMWGIHFENYVKERLPRFLLFRRFSSLFVG